MDKSPTEDELIDQMEFSGAGVLWTLILVVLMLDILITSRAF